ncbi:YraN family protein [uncultured Clostridium sp.]|uniref:YraN family protein n=1 Tax=uncultured Clostridium sp. TaxID=59620 RepID=UPI0025CE98CD|nr:YraN family protein [uncultured Clostridium sp.]
MKNLNKNIGNYAEKLASDYLIHHHYKIIERNFRNNLGEIDIICIKSKILIIVEVKGRYNLSYGKPQEAVNYIKQKSLIKVASSYINYKNLYNFNVRFDVIEVFFNNDNSLYEINHIKDAFRL